MVCIAVAPPPPQLETGAKVLKLSSEVIILLHSGGKSGVSLIDVPSR